MSQFELSIKSVTDDTVVLEGNAIVWDSVDLSGEFFGRDVDLYDAFLPERVPILWEHAREGIGAKILGYAEKLTRTDIGLRARLVLDGLGDLRDTVVDLVRKGQLGLSSGSVAHLTKRDGNRIVRWPLAEISLTTRPMEPGTMSLEFAMKSGLWDVDYTLRAMKRAQLVDELWEFVGKAKDPDERRAWELRADLLELEGDIERMQHERKLERKSRLIKRLRELEG